MSSYVYDVLEKMAATASKKEKLAIVQSVVGTPDEELFKRVVHYAYSPFLQFNLKKFESPEPHDGNMELVKIFEILDDLASGNLSGNLAKAMVATVLGALSEHDAEVFARILKKDLRVGASANTFNKVWPDLVYCHPYQRCSSYSAKNLKRIKKPCDSEVKMDGKYGDIIITDEGVVYRSRDGLIQDLNTPERDAEMMDIYRKYGSVVLMGESLVIGDDGKFHKREIGNGILNSDDKDISKIGFVLWDVVPYRDFKAGICNIKREDRVEMLQRILNRTNLPYFQEVERVSCENVSDIIAHFKHVVLNGGEGTVIKNRDAIWEDGTSADQVKIKIDAEGEVIITGVNEGANRLIGSAGSLSYESSDGLLKGTIAGLSDGDRKKYFKNPELVVGKIASVLFNDIVFSATKGCYSLYLPRVSEIRSDKTEADSLERLQEQLKSAVDACAAMLAL